MGVRIGIDTGGTFTDLVGVDEAGRWRLSKVPSDPADPVAAIGAAAVPFERLYRVPPHASPVAYKMPSRT